MNLIKCFVLVFLTHSLSAQNGWDKIKQNNHKEARKIFLDQLEKDSMHTEALQGMIFLSDIEEDERSYAKYVNRLIVKDWNNYTFSVLSSYCTEKFDDILNNTTLNIANKLDYILGKAEKLHYERKFDEARKIYSDNITKLNWSYIGPFKNINGYGYEKTYEPETEKFTPDAIYKNHRGQQLTWVTPKYTNNKGTINFSQHLNSDTYGNVYYANTFIELDEDKQLQLRISRKYPIKIWIDDELIFENKERINFQWDFEKINFVIKSGTHRMLVKYCVGSYYSGKKNNDYDDYDDYDDYSDSWLSELYQYFSYSNMPYGKSNISDLTIRITDENGQLVKNIISYNQAKEYTKGNIIKKQVIEKESINFYKNLVKENPENYFAYYMLYKSALAAGLTEEIEEIFYRQLLKNPDITFFKYLAAEVYKKNGKNEKAHRVLSNINHDKTPVFSLLYKELKELDKEYQEEKYLAKINQLLEITPSNLSAIKTKLNFLDKKGNKEEKKKYAESIIKTYPDYKSSIEKYLKDDNKPTDHKIGNKEEINTKKEEALAAKNIKKYFYKSDYTTLIDKYKGENKPAKALQLYDELIKIEPWVFSTRIDKAKYLYNIDKNTEAIKELEELETIKPNTAQIYELKGDIYNDLKDEKTALEYYQKAKSLSNGSGYSYYGLSESSGLDEKIEKLAGQKQLRNKFNSKSFDEMFADKSWQEIYKDEESVIVGYTTDIIMENDGNISLYTRMLIHILTESGATSWTEYNFNMLGNLTLVKVVKKNGAEITPDKRGTFVVFKNLEKGDYIKLEGKTKWNSSTEMGNNMNLFNVLSLHAPVYYAKLEIAVPQGHPFYYSVHKVKDNLQKTNLDGFDFYKWEYKEIDKVTEEDAVIDLYDLYPIIQTSTLNGWEDVVDWYMAKTYRKLEPNYELLELRDSIIKPGMTQQEKIVAIYNYITKDINYSFTTLLQSNYIPKNTDLTISSRIGDCKDVATLMISLLQLEGIESYYALVKTNQYFHAKILPAQKFDHVIAAYVIDGKMNFVDLTTNHYPYYVLNENDVAAWALLIRPGEKEIFQLPADNIDPLKNLVEHHITATLNKNKSLDIEVHSIFSGIEGGYLREKYFNKSKTTFQNEILNIMGNGVFENISLKEHKFENMNDITQPLKGTFKFKALNFADNIMDIHFMRIPYMIGIIPSPVISGNMRYNSIKLSSITQTEPCKQYITINFTPGTSFTKIPKDIYIDNKYGIYSVKFKKTGNSLQIEKYQQFKDIYIPVEEFEAFKEFYLDLVDKDRMKIAINVAAQ